MTTVLLPSVALVERSLAFTLGALVTVSTAHLDNPTPCHDWDLGDLLEHLDDSLGAFVEAAQGRVAPVRTRAPEGDVLTRLRDGASSLLAAWSDPPVTAVTMGHRALPADLLLGAAALEIAVHGWDVAQATGHPRPLPAGLARELWPVALRVVDGPDRPGRFAAAVTPRASASPSARLLGFLGRIA